MSPSKVKHSLSPIKVLDAAPLRSQPKSQAPSKEAKHDGAAFSRLAAHRTGFRSGSIVAQGEIFALFGQEAKPALAWLEQLLENEPSPELLTQALV